ncbi:hypothetical protein PInf_009812 [Phytophthora infestans]|nr:hypothetical protein PInf_009812 [Phytophthora infestans]
MVYTPRRYLISAAAALVAMQMQQVSCTSLFYDPVTSANTTDEISSKFPARGGQVTDQDCAITVEVDPTLPDITTISTVTVTYTELLANTSTAPTEAVSTLVGKAVLCETIPATDANQDAYTTTTTTSTSTFTTQSTQSSTTSSSGGKTTHTKSGTTVSQTSTSKSTTTSTKTGININPSASSSVAGSSAEETTSTTKTGVTTAPSTSSSSMAGSLAEETNLTILPSTKTGVTTAPTTSTSVAGSSDVETTGTASPPKTGVTTTTAAPSADETSSSTNIEVTTAPTAPSTSYSSVAGSSTEDAKSTSAPSTKTRVTSAPTTALDVAGSSDVETTATASPTKTGVVTPPTAPSVDDDSKEEPNCATGWEEESSRKLRHSPMSGRRLEEKFEKKRQLEANTNKDIAKLEAYFGTSMESTLANLPTVGVHTPSPWPGPYWPTYQDSINVIWSAGEPSPAEKYATAFGLDVDDFMNKVSADNGVDSMSSRTVCSSDSDCSSLTDGSSCAIRAGKSSGYCIPTWFGICHAWAPAAMIEEEPKCAVTHNGVTFQPMDLKALISDVYDGASVSTALTGTRFNGGTDSTDEYGRHSSDAYRDLNPAYFHIAASNLLGKLNATFVADVTAGVRADEMTLEEAAQTFYGLEEYPWNAAAKSIVYVKTRLSWIFETYTDGGLVSSGKVDSYTTGAYYTYLLEMDDDGAIIGGEWVYDSDDDHPDFLWFPKAKPAADTVTSIGLSYGDVAMLLEKSVACTGSSSGSVDAGSSVSASASASASTLGSVGASTSGSTASLSLPGSDSTGSAPFTSSGTSSTGSEDAATVVPVTEAPVATETPVATQTSTDTSTTTPVSTTATPATTTATPSSNQGSNPYWNGNGGNQGSNQHWSGHWGDNDSDDSQQDHSWLSWLHW